MKVFIFIFAALLVVGCSDTPFKVENPKSKTTQEILDLAADSSATTYVLVELDDDVVYAVNINIKLAEYKFVNTSGSMFTILLLLFFTLFAILFFIITILTDK